MTIIAPKDYHAVIHCCYDLSGLLAAVLFARPRDKNELLEVPIRYWIK